MDSSPPPAHPWIAHYPEGVAWDAEIPLSPLHEWLDRAVQHYPEHIALDFLGKLYTYRELGEKVNRFARGLHALGYGKGSRIGLFMSNCPQYVIAYFAALRIGAVVVNYNPLYSPRELERQIHDSATEAMVTLNLALLYPKIAPYLGTTGIRHVIVGNFPSVLPPAKAALYALAKAREIARFPHDERHVTFQQMLSYPPEVQTADIDPSRDLAVLQYTGGTTGTPKAAMLTHGNISANIRQCRLWFAGARDGGEIILGALPLFHVFAMTTVMNFAVASGFRMILHPRFELRRMLEDIQAKRPTLMAGVPTMFATILNDPKLARYDLTSLRMCISGGAGLPVEVKRRFEEVTGCALFEGYGLSETSPVAACNPIRGVNKPGSIGMPLPGTILEVVDKEDRRTLLKQGEIGEICIRGPQVMLGYLDRPEETAEVLRGGRLHTGDVGYMDGDGYFFIVDRIKEMILSGGYNVYPRNIEEALYAHPAVRECAVIGIPHPTRGQVPKAFVVTQEGVAVTEREIKDFLRDRLSAYCLPQAVVFRETLPKSIIGKILKKELMKEECEPKTQSGEKAY